MLFKDMAIRRKLMSVILLTSGVVLLLTCAAFIAYELLSFRQTMVRNVSTLGEIIAANSTAALAFDNPEDAQEILAALQAERHIVAASLYDKNGKLFSKYPANLPATALPAAPEGDGYRFAHAHLAAFHPVVHGGRRLGTLYLRSDMGAMYERFQLYSGIVVLVVAASLLVAYLLSRALQRQISHPILALVETAKAISDRRDYSVRATKHSQDELGLLTDAFNHMLTQIQAQDRALRESEARLHELNQELERRVVERTTQLEAIEAINNELEAFSYSVSHDLRAPLRHIDGFTGLLERHAEPALDDKGRRYLKTISEAVKQMDTLIDDLLTFSRLGRAELRHGPVRLKDLVDEVRRILDPEIAGRAVVWAIGELPEVQGDPQLLRLVLQNLIGNALKYTRTRPEARIEIGARREDAETVCSIRDNGVGFDMRYVERLFGVFQRLHASAEFEGTGIGLASVGRIVRRHGGRVWAEGEVDRGACFSFALPDRDVAPAREPHRSA